MWFEIGHEFMRNGGIVRRAVMLDTHTQDMAVKSERETRMHNKNKTAGTKRLDLIVMCMLYEHDVYDALFMKVALFFRFFLF